MNRYEILATLRSGRDLYVTGRGTAEEEATLSALYDRDLIEVEQYGRGLLIRWKQPKPRRFVRVRVVVPTWYGARIVEQWLEVE
jgi:hypothetical protein